LVRQPDSADAYSKLAIAYTNQQMWEDAIVAAQRSLQIQPDHVPTRDLLAEAIYRKQQKEKASENTR
jgi:cytochrome c-type biogenesis protein CcmH/NrfG